MSLNNICRCNEELLSELIGAIHQLPIGVYSARTPNTNGQSIGAHARHIIEFYQCLFSGLEQQKINYDVRPRDPNCQVEEDAGIASLKSILIELTNLRLSSSLSEVTLTSVIDDEGQSLTITTSLQRELLFLHSHTTHHMAIINLLMRQAGHPPEYELGVANSTQIHRNAEKVSG